MRLPNGGEKHGRASPSHVTSEEATHPKNVPHCNLFVHPPQVRYDPPVRRQDCAAQPPHTTLRNPVIDAHRQHEPGVEPSLIDGFVSGTSQRMGTTLSTATRSGSTAACHPRRWKPRPRSTVRAKLSILPKIQRS
jgi:hypothetical protein